MEHQLHLFCSPSWHLFKNKGNSVPLSPMCIDALTWAYSPSGNFEGKLAYKLLKGGLESPNNLGVCVEMLLA